MRPATAKPGFISRHGSMALPGERVKIVFAEQATESGKKITRGMLKSIWMNWRTGMCFEDFNSSNIYVSSEGEVKFKGIKRLRKKTQAEHEVQTRQNYLQAHRVLADIFKGKKLPEDINHLLQMILNEPHKFPIYHIHASLAKEGTKWYMYVKMYDHLIKTVSDQVREYILLKLPYQAVWRSKVTTNELLDRTFNFNPNQYVVTEEKLAAKLLKKGIVWANLTAAQQARHRLVAEAQHFPDFLRHRTAHRMDHLAWGKYTAEGSDMVTGVRFPLAMAHLQDELLNANEIDELKLEEFF